MTTPTFLWVTADLAEPPRAGGELRVSRLMRGLSTRAQVDVVLLSPTANAEAIRAATGASSVLHVPVPKEPIRKRTRALHRAWPMSAAAVYQPKVASIVRRHNLAGATIIAEHLRCAPYLAEAGSTVLSLQNADAAMLRAARPPSGWRRLEHQWNVSAAARLERWALGRADITVCVSDVDRSLLRENALVVPNGTDLPDQVGPVPVAGRILFVGSLNYPPNADAVRWWLSDVAPHLSADLPPLTVVGRGASRVLADLHGHTRLNLIGEVDAVGPYLESATVVVVPIRSGGGSRLKAIEGLGYGRPVVGTTKGMEGFAVTDGTDFLLADDGQAFAAAVLMAYSDRALAARLGAAGRLFASAYDWRDIGERFAGMLIAAVTTARRAR